MALLLQSVGTRFRSGIVKTWNAVNLGWNKLSTQVAGTAAWQRTSNFAGPYIKTGISYYPDAMKFDMASRNFVAGVMVGTVCLTAASRAVLGK